MLFKNIKHIPSNEDSLLPVEIVQIDSKIYSKALIRTLNLANDNC